MTSALKRGVQDYSQVCSLSTAAQLGHTVVTFVVEHANPKGTYLVVAGTMADAKAVSVTGTSEDARRRAAQLAREVTGEALFAQVSIDGAWQHAFGGGEELRDGKVTMKPGTPVTLGSLDPDIIRSTVREHADQIRSCYESELSRTPGIFGKIVIKWVIDSEGKVVQASTAETKMNNANVEACLASHIRTWVFPKPKGGGVVIVNYPFVFKHAD